MSDGKQLLKERGTVSINAMNLWELLQDVIKTDEHVRVYRENPSISENQACK